MTLWRRDVVISQRNDGSSPNGFSQIFYGAEKQDMNGDDSLSEETYFQVSDGIQSRDFIGTAFRLQGGTVESTVFDVHVFHNDVAFGLGTP